MTSNASPPPPGGPAGRRRALGRGPGAPRPAEPAADVEPTDVVGPGALPAGSADSGGPPEETGAAEPGVESAGAGDSGVGSAEAVAAPARPEYAAEPARAEFAPGGAGTGREGVSPEAERASGQPGREAARTAAGHEDPTPGSVATAGTADPAAEPVGTEERRETPGSDPVAVGAGPEAEGVPSPAGVEAGGTGGPGGTTQVPADADDGVFKVRLANFEGPFDLLLQLISKHKLDVTEVALSKVTDEFMAHIRAMGPDWDLDETTEFLVVAATLLDLKAARLLPAAEVEDEADLALLEARDLLFARLLQYRAYKQIADIFSGRLDDEARRYPRTVGLEPHHAELLPEVVISIGAEGFAKLAVKAMQPRPKPQVYVDHIHAPLVSVQEQAQIVVARLRELGEASFRALVEDTDDTLTVVARFLALLELYREKAVALEQEAALGELLVRWTGGDGDETPTVTDEFDRPPEPPKEEKKA
ncbi:segregation/condensation protein A [Streptomyces sp. NPDC006140]|uniref:segregation/condensation protein A n=1 Tax=Streptomyces sp. NPDC006140 TaxID=3154579 RepID=UPI0033D4CB08